MRATGVDVLLVRIDKKMELEHAGHVVEVQESDGHQAFVLEYDVCRVHGVCLDTDVSTAV